MTQVRRSLPAVALGLLGGVLAAVGLAWTLSLFASPAAFASRPSDPTDPWTRSFVASLPSDEPWQLQSSQLVVSQPGSTYIRQRASAVRPTGLSACRHYDGAVARHGWPMRALQYEVRRLIPGPAARPGESRTPQVLDGMQVAAVGGGSWYWQKGLVPLRPVWPGLAVDALILGAVLAILWRAPRSARRFVRARDARCLTCGYPVTASAVCPECGHGHPAR